MSGVTSEDLQFNVPNVQPVHVENVPTVSMAALSGPVAPSSGNLAQTAAHTDYSFQWIGGATVNHVMLQNNTGGSINFDIDAAASAGSPVLANGQTLFLDVSMATLHLYTATAQNVNGTVAGNIVIRAWQ